MADHLDDNLGKDASNLGDYCPHIEQQLKDVEQLVNEFRQLLVRYETAIGDETLRQKMETLESWAEHYRFGLQAAGRISRFGAQWLGEAQEKLKLAADELARMESEGPAAAPQDESIEAEDYLRATRKIDKIIPAVKQAVAPSSAASQTDQPDKQKEMHHENA